MIAERAKPPCNPGAFLLALAAILIGLAAAIALPNIPVPDINPGDVIIPPGDLDDLPLSKHAAAGRTLGQAWDALAVRALVSSGRCNPVIVYSCPTTDQVKYVCQVEAGADAWAGLIVGIKSRLIISGWLADWKYWWQAGIRDGCTMFVYNNPGGMVMP